MTDNQRINVKALALGVLTDIGGTLLIGSILGVLAGIILGVKGTTEDELHMYLHGPIAMGLSLIIGLGLTVLGGFVAGRVSKSREIFHGGMVGFIGIFFGLLFWTTVPLWYNITSLLAIVPFGMLGGRIAATIPKKK